MSVRIAVRMYRGATVLVLSGPADSLDSVRQTLVPVLTTPGLVVVDVDPLTKVDPRRLRELVVGLLHFGGDPERLRLVAGRNTMVQSLTRGRIHHVVPLHRTVDDAIAVHYASRVTPSRRLAGATHAR